MYRSQGRLRRFTIGTYSDLRLVEACKQAAVIRNAVAQGDDPALHKQNTRQGPTVTDIALLYIERHAKVHKKSWRDDVRLLGREVLPTCGTRKAQTITRADVLLQLQIITAQRGSGTRQMGPDGGHGLDHVVRHLLGHLIPALLL